MIVLSFIKKQTMSLLDAHQRQINYLRVSVTDHCNYRCHYCRPEDDKTLSTRDEILSYEEIVRVVNIFATLGVYKVRLTGGEPLLRKDIVKLVGLINANPNIQDIPLSTNAHLLEKYAKPLYDAGVNRANISIDSLDETRFRTITRGGDLNKVLQGIDAAIAVGMSPIKLNMVVMRWVNDDEIEAMVDFAISKGIEVRFIETMPIGQSGIEALSQHYTQAQIETRLQAYLPNQLTATPSAPSDGPAQNLHIANTNSNIGVISAVSNHFCATCNRLRLTAKGLLILCLGQENSLSLRDLLRAGKTDEQIRQAIIKAVQLKPEKHDFVENLNNIELRNMVEMGG